MKVFYTVTFGEACGPLFNNYFDDLNAAKKFCETHTNCGKIKTHSLRSESQIANFENQIKFQKEFFNMEACYRK